jgi:hypothetical protein
MLLLAAALLGRHLVVFHCRRRSPCGCVRDGARRFRALSPTQACVAWVYLLAAALALAGLRCVALALDSASRGVGSGSGSEAAASRLVAAAGVAGVCGGGALAAVGGWAAALRWSAALEVYTGDQEPLQVFQVGGESRGRRLVQKRDSEHRAALALLSCCSFGCPFFKAPFFKKNIPSLFLGPRKWRVGRAGGGASL